MKHGSLFSGIGGFDLAAEWMGWENVFNVELDPFCRKVLKHHFPNSKSFTDVRKFDPANFLGRVQILSGGFPCQPFSTAGKRKGTSDERHLWPEFFRIIKGIRPRYVLAENVRGLTSWGGGSVLEQVCLDLESEGYEVFPVVLGAASVNAPHKRERIWVLASNRYGEVLEYGNSKRAPERSTNQEKRTKPFNSPRGWEKFPSFGPICRGVNGLPEKLDSIPFSKWRKESVKAYGNSIVPQVAYELFKVIAEIDQNHE